MKDQNNQIQERQNWIGLGTQGAAELNRTFPDLAKAEHSVLDALRMIAAAVDHPNEDRFVDQTALLCILAHVYAEQRRTAVAYMVADYVTETIFERWPAERDPGLSIWLQLLDRLQQLFLLVGRPEKALDLAVLRLERIREMTELLLEEEDDFLPDADWVQSRLPEAEHAVLHVRMRQYNDEERFSEIKQLLREAS